MYILLIILHSLFIFIAHLFGFYIIEGVFLALMLFFLLYFSPIFFFKKQNADGEDDLWELFSFNLSPQKSLVIPLVLTYIGIYILAFTFSGNVTESIHAHIIIFLGIFTIFLGYIFAFEWKEWVFFDVLGFHLLFSYITIIAMGIFYFFSRDGLWILDVIFSLVTLWFSIFFFHFETKYRKEFFLNFLVSLFLTLEIILIFGFREIGLYMIIGFFGILAMALFESSAKYTFFRPFFHLSRVFSLSVVLWVTAILSLLIFWNFHSIYFLLIFAAFLLSVHTRFSNIVAYSAAIFIVYFVYWLVFVSLLSTASPLSSLLFIFFFPLLAIGNTYFWEEKQKYDFAIIHYSSIGFAGIFFLYSIVFLNWESSTFIFSSFWFLLLASLFFLSYFRFYKK